MHGSKLSKSFVTLLSVNCPPFASEVIFKTVNSKSFKVANSYRWRNGKYWTFNIKLQYNRRIGFLQADCEGALWFTAIYTNKYRPSCEEGYRCYTMKFSLKFVSRNKNNKTTELQEKTSIVNLKQIRTWRLEQWLKTNRCHSF